jgi:CheY-like chemotaxis protein
MDAQQQELLTIARSSAESLMVILNDILDFSKIEAGQLSLNKVPMNLVPWLEEVLDSFTPTAHQKGLSIDYWIEPDVPIQIYGDPDRLRQVLTNLISNGVKFTHQGGLSIRVSTIHPADHPTVLRIDVCDTGIGIAPEVQSRLFNPFTQGDNATTRRFGGTGLGLAISRRIIQLMDGSIGLESVPDQGSRFWLEIPVDPIGTATTASLIPPVTSRKLTRSIKFTPSQHGTKSSQRIVSSKEINSDNPPPPQPHASDSDTSQLDFSNLSVLVVEDNPINERVIRRMLQRMNIQPTVARTGAEAETLANEQPFSVILMDFQLPDINGIDVTRRIRRGHGVSRGAFIVALTANIRPEDRIDGSDAGMSSYLNKPVRLNELQQMLQQASSRPPTEPENSVNTSPEAT